MLLSKFYFIIYS